MNKDQIKGAVKEVAGRLQRKFGDTIGNLKQSNKGTAKVIEGRTQQLVGDSKEVLKDATRKP